MIIIKDTEAAKAFRYAAVKELLNLEKGSYTNKEIGEYLASKGIKPLNYDELSTHQRADMWGKVLYLAVKAGLFWKATRLRKVLNAAGEEQKVIQYVRTDESTLKALPPGMESITANPYVYQGKPSGVPPGKITKLQQPILEAIRKHGPITDVKLAELFPDINVNAVRNRRSQLARHGYVVQAGRVSLYGNITAATWKAA